MVGIESYLTAVSVLVAAGALWLSKHDATRQVQLQVLVDVGGEYRQAWRTRWRDLPKAVADVGGDLSRLAKADRDNLEDALAWIDWFGIACDEGVLARHEFMFRTVGPSMRALIKAGLPLVEADEKAHGADYWDGLRYVERELRNFDRPTS